MAGPTTESSITLSDGLKVFTQTWKTTLEKPLAYAFFLHGFSDHCNAYYSFFPTLASRGIEVFSYDQRGWGRTCTTKAQRGLTGPNTKIMQDIDEIIAPRLALSESQHIPHFLMGHSNGGGIALWYAIHGTHRDRLAGVVLQSPLIGLHPHIKPWFTTIAAGKLAAKLLPNFQMVNKLDPRTMSRDKEVCRKYDEDPLCHDTGTLVQLADMLERGKLLQTEAVTSRYKEDLPLLVAHGTGDKCTDYAASKTLYDKVHAKDKTFLSYDGWYHKLHAEISDDSLKFANDIADWILQRASKASSASGPSAPTVAKL